MTNQFVLPWDDHKIFQRKDISSSQDLRQEIKSRLTGRFIGDHPVILYNYYDKNQLWFPFVTAVLLHIEVETPTPPKIDVHRHIAKDYVVISNDDRVLFLPEANVPQLFLPFDGWRKVSRSMWRRLTKADFPTWERQSDGRPLSFHYDVPHSVIEDFCDLNCKGQYFITRRGRAYFELKADYAIMRIAFQTVD